MTRVRSQGRITISFNMISKDLSKLGYTSSIKELGVPRVSVAEGRGELNIPGEGGGGGGGGQGGGGGAGLEDIQEEREEVVTAGLENLSIS